MSEFISIESADAFVRQQLSIWNQFIRDYLQQEFAGNEKMERIREYLAPDYHAQLAAKVRAKRMQLRSTAVSPEAQQHLPVQIAQLEEIEQFLFDRDRARAPQKSPSSH